MFEKEKPELVQVSTPPNVRLDVLEAAEAAGVPLAIVEKPLAIQGEDYVRCETSPRASRKSRSPSIISCNFIRGRQRLQKLVADGAIGDLRFIEASSGMNLAYQGTHSLAGDRRLQPGERQPPSSGKSPAPRACSPNVKEHYAPDQSLAAVEYDNGVQATLRCGENAPRVPRGDAIYQHKRIAVLWHEGLYPLDDVGLGDFHR